MPAERHTPQHVFVYGTLKVGHCRWPILEPMLIGGAQSMIDTSVTGVLFDTGLDYPAARFDLPGTIIGQIGLLRPDSLDVSLRTLDQVEGAVVGHYERVVVETAAGLIAWSYAYRSSLDGLTALDGQWIGS